MRPISDDIKDILSHSSFGIKISASIWRYDGISKVDEQRVATLIPISCTYDEILDDGIVKSQINMEIADPTGSLFPYGADSPTSFLGNRLKVYATVWSKGYGIDKTRTFKLGEFWIENNPDVTLPYVIFNPDGSVKEHVGGKVKINATDRLTSIGKEVFVKKLRAMSQPAPEALRRICKDIDWADRDINLITDNISDKNVTFPNTTTENNYWGTVYPEDVSNSVRIVMSQIGYFAYSDADGNIRFRQKNDNTNYYDCTPRARLKSQNIKLDPKDVFNAIIVEDMDVDKGEYEGQKGNQTGFYKLTSNKLFTYGRYRRLYKKFSVDEVPNAAVAVKKMNDSIAESTRMTFKSVIMPDLQCGDRVLVNPRIGDVDNRLATVLELNHDFDAGTTDATVGLLLDDLVSCPNLGFGYSIEGDKFMRQNI